MRASIYWLLSTLTLGCKDHHPIKDSSEPWPVDESTGLRVATLPPLVKLEQWGDNESTESKLALGYAIFNDFRLSGSQLVSCSTCHLPTQGFTSGSSTDTSDRAYPHLTPVLARNTPSLLNQVYARAFHWDGRPADIYEVWVLPFGEPQMNLTDLPQDDIWTTDDPTAQIRLQQRFTEDVPGYVDWFDRAYDVDIRESTPEEVWDLTGKAISVYMRKAVSVNSPFDRWNQGEKDAMEEDAIRGMETFLGDGGCVNCHSGSLFSDFQYHNLSLTKYDDEGEPIDLGRAKVTEDEADLGKYLTPMLRTVTMTSPYFHDGSVLNLRDAIRHHGSSEARMDPNYDPLLDVVPEFTDNEIDDLIAFLSAIRGEPMDRQYLSVTPELP